jgi:ubiquitin conjugation factor E4 B
VAQIRLKRLAKLQAAASNSADSPNTAGSSTPASPSPKPQPKPTPPPRLHYPHSPKRPFEPPAVSPVPPKKVQATPRKLNLQSWEDETLGSILKVTLQVCETLYSSPRSDTNLLCNLCYVIQKEVAESSGYDIVWLKELAAELESENSGFLK